MNKQSNSIVEIVDQITKTQEAPCKKTLQKIVYLIEQKGANLGFDYGIHFYGPYSATLDYTVQQLCADGYLKIEYKNEGHIISKISDVSISGNQNYVSIINNVVNQFGNMSPSELELISTALFVARNLDNINMDSIRSGVKKIKGAKYSDEQIGESINTLMQNEYFSLS